MSSLTGAGLDELKRVMIAAAAEAPSRDSQALARLPIDRVFTMKGFGTVVTGTLISGTIHREEELEVFPTGRTVRVRGVQVHGQSADAAIAGQRTALNLAGASTEDLARGMTLAPAGDIFCDAASGCAAELLSSAPRALKSRARVHFHSNTMETVAEIALHGGKQLAPGAEAFARLKLPEAALLLPGDRFIIRQFSPVVTIGGGVVVDAAPVPRMAELQSFLRVMDGDDTESKLTVRIARRGHGGISMARLVAETGWSRKSLEARLASALQQGRVLRTGDLFVDAPAMAGLRKAILGSVDMFHRKNSLVGGIAREALREQVKASAEIFAAAIDLLVRERKIEDRRGCDAIARSRRGDEGRGVGVEAENRRGFCFGRIESSGAARGDRRPQRWTRRGRRRL